jgi:hypothetical protein
VSPVRYEPGSYIPEDDILHSHRRENLKSYTSQNLLGGRGKTDEKLSFRIVGIPSRFDQSTPEIRIIYVSGSSSVFINANTKMPN